jgi:dTDP-4-amino-4,6-dideoxygalactose transaminase
VDGGLVVIPLFKVFMSDEVNESLSPVLSSGYIGEGEQVKRFEYALGQYIQNNNIAVVNSGTAAITIALRLAGVTQGDWVISTPMTCMATNQAVLSLGAHIMWADVKINGNINPDSVSRLFHCTPHDRMVKAVICIDWGGNPCDLKELKDISDRHNISVIEDACQAIGSVYHERPVGNHVDFVCFSFQAIKYLTTVDGGALVVNKSELLHDARLMRWFGLDRERSVDMRCDQDPPFWGYKAQGNDVLATIGLANIKHLQRLIDRTNYNAAVYNAAFNQLKTIHPVPVTNGAISNHWLYTLLVDDANDFIAYANSNGVMCSKVHDRNDIKYMFQRYRRTLSGVDYFNYHHVCIPVGWWLSDKDVGRVVDLVLKYDKLKGD